MSAGREDILVVDRVDDMRRLAAVLAVGLVGLKDCSVPEARGGLIDLAWDLSDKLAALSDDLAPNGEIKT